MAIGVAIVATTPGFDVVVCFGVVPPPAVLLARGIPFPPVPVAPPPRTFPISVQNPSKGVTSLRLDGATEETYSAQVKTASSNMLGAHAVLL